MVEIKGLQKMSLLEYPGKVSCVVFLPGCNFRCPFCHNPDMILSPGKTDTMPEGEFFEFLQARKKWLDAVAVTGGEPTLHRDLPEFLRKIKSMGYLVELETNGTNPEMLARLINDGLVDYFAMDIKGPLERYREIVRREVDTNNIQKSINLIRESGVPYEFRTTFIPGLVDKGDMKKIGEWLKGIDKYVIQQFRPDSTLDKAYESKVPYSKEGLEGIAAIARGFFRNVEVRA